MTMIYQRLGFEDLPMFRESVTHNILGVNEIFSLHRISTVRVSSHQGLKASVHFLDLIEICVAQYLPHLDLLQEITVGTFRDSQSIMEEFPESRLIGF